MIPSYIPRHEVTVLVDGLRKDHDVFVPCRHGSHIVWRRLTGGDTDAAAWPISEPRSVEPLKAFFFASRECVADGFQDGLPQAPRPAALIGTKACDLAGLDVLDKVFLEGEYRDPHYERRRESTLIVCADCARAGETCFCTAMHGRPYVQTGFDLNLSEVEGGFVVEAGTPRGEALLGRLSFQPATPLQVRARDERRAEVTAQVLANAAASGVPDRDELEGAVRKAYEAPLWTEEAQRCVECGACNTICPTCHCFLLADLSRQDRFARLRWWDSCLIKDFARVAGGANPRPRLAMRLRNRFEKKFDFFPKTNGLYACTGCGRCVSACPGRIDIRKILRGLVDYVSKHEPVSAG